MRRALILLLGLAATSAWCDEVRLGCSPGDKACAIAKGRQHPARQLASWKETMARPLHVRQVLLQ